MGKAKYGITFIGGFITGSLLALSLIPPCSVNMNKPATVKITVDQYGQKKEIQGKLTEQTTAIFRKYQIEIEDKYKGIKVKSPLYEVDLPNRQRLFFASAYVLNNGRMTPLNEKKQVRAIPVDTSFLKNIEEKFKEAGINNTIGNYEKPTIYVIFDAFCPFCIEEFDKKFPEMVKNHHVILLPLAVHGEKSLKALACMYSEAKEKSIDKVLKEHFSRFNGNWESYERSYKDCEFDKDTYNLIKNTTEKLLKYGVYMTPTFFIQDQNGKFWKKVGADIKQDKQQK